MENDFEVVGKLSVNDSNAVSTLQSLTGATQQLGGIIQSLANPSIAGMTELIESLGASLAPIILVIAALVLAVQEVTFAFQAFRKVIDMASEVEQVDTKLQAIISSTQKLGGVTMDMASQVATSLEHLTGVDDETIKGAESILLTFGNISKDAFPKATEAAMNISAAFGKDLTSAAFAVGKALESPANASAMLRRMGIILDQQTQQQIKSLAEHGRIAEADALILKKLEERVGGVAEAMGGTFQGELGKVKNIFDDLQEDIGSIFLPVLTQVVAMFRIVAEEMVKGLQPGIQAAQQGFKELSAAMRTPEMRQALKELGGELGRVIGELLPVLIRGAIDFLKRLAENFKEHGPEMVTGLRNIASSFATMAAVIAKAIDTFTAFLDIIDLFKNVGKMIVDGIVKGIMGDPEAVSKALKGIIDRAISDIKRILGIASPSKLMNLEIGKWLPHGVADGVNENAHVVTSAMKGMTSRITGAVEAPEGGGVAAAAGNVYHLYNAVFHVQDQDTMDSLMARMNVTRMGS